jgi:hypothetical protein
LRKIHRLGGLAVAAVIGVLSVPGAASAQIDNIQSASPEDRVDGSNLARVDHEGGRFEQGAGGWTEYDSGGQARFQFEETGRDEWSVYLIDRSRNVALQLDVHRRMIALIENGRRGRDLYAITDAASVERGDYVQRIQQRQARERRQALLLQQQQQDQLRLQQQARLGGRVDGSNLARANYAGGRFEQVGGGWAEYDLAGRVHFRFEETGRDEWSVYLLDPSRDMRLALDVHRRMVTIAATGGRWDDLYPIIDMAAANSAYSRTIPNGTAIRGSFYQQQGRPEVMFQFADSYHCLVQNPSQMSAYGGWSRVQKVRSLAMRGESTGACGWPDGFFRRVDQPAVYRLYGLGPMKLGRYSCHVVDPPQMERFGGFGQLVTVEASSDLFRGRERPTECSNP